ncbi:MAG: TerB family tellurite resistance protein [Bacillota bacterium]
MFTSLVSFLEQRFAPVPGVPSVAPTDLRVATAALLVEMARADFDEAEVELQKVGELLAERYGLEGQDATALIAAARAESDHAVSLFRFTHLINQHLEMPDKQQLMDMLWDVAYADGRLDKHEDALMHKLSDLLYVPLPDLMRAKEEAKKRLKARNKSRE